MDNPLIAALMAKKNKAIDKQRMVDLFSEMVKALNQGDEMKMPEMKPDLPAKPISVQTQQSHA